MGGREIGAVGRQTGEAAGGIAGRIKGAEGGGPVRGVGGVGMWWVVGDAMDVEVDRSWARSMRKVRTMKMKRMGVWEVKILAKKKQSMIVKKMLKLVENHESTPDCMRMAAL